MSVAKGTESCTVKIEYEKNDLFVFHKNEDFILIIINITKKSNWWFLIFHNK